MKVWSSTFTFSCINKWELKKFSDLQQIYLKYYALIITFYNILWLFLQFIYYKLMNVKAVMYRAD